METNKEIFDFHEIKTFEDARRKLNWEELQLADKEAQRQAEALYKLLIIQKAINNNVWCDEDGWNYYPYWVLYSEKGMKRMSENEKQIYDFKELTLCTNGYTIYSGVRCAVANGGAMMTAYGYPLSYHSKEAALYAGRQFEDLFFQYYGIKVKE